jgi:hypothetical protein
MDECHPSLSYCLPRRSRWERPYACIAVAKGLITPASTGWAAICQQFSPFLLKRVPFGGRNRKESGEVCRRAHKTSWLHATCLPHPKMHVGGASSPCLKPGVSAPTWMTYSACLSPCDSAGWQHLLELETSGTHRKVFAKGYRYLWLKRTMELD